MSESERQSQRERDRNFAHIRTDIRQRINEGIAKKLQQQESSNAGRERTNPFSGLPSSVLNDPAENLRQRSRFTPDEIAQIQKEKLRIRAELQGHREREANSNQSEFGRNRNELFKLTGTLGRLQRNGISGTDEVNTIVSRVQTLRDRQKAINPNLPAEDNVKNALRTVNDLARQREAFDRNTISVREFGRQAALAFKRYSAFLIGTFAINKLASFFHSGTDAALEFEHTLTKLEQLLEISEGRANDFGEAIRDVGVKTGISFNEIGKGIEILAQAGFKFKGLSEITNISELLAKTQLAPTFGSIGETVDGLIAIFGQFNKTLSDTGQIFDLVNQFSADFAVESKDIFEAVKRGGAAFHVAGGNLEEFVSLFSLLRSSTRESADTLGTFFKSGLAKLLSPQSQGRLGLLGVGPGSLVTQLTQLSEIIKDPKFSELEKIDIAVKLTGDRQFARLLALLRELGDPAQANKVRTSLEKSLGSLDKAAKARLDDVGTSLNRIRNAFESLSTSFLKSDGIKSFAQTLANITTFAGKAISSLSGLSPVILAIGAAITASLGREFFGGFFERFGVGKGLGGFIRSPKKLLGAGLGVAALAGGSLLANSLSQSQDPVTAGIGNRLGGAVSGGLVGASIGSIFPGLGTAIGATIGAFAGLIVAINAASKAERQSKFDKAGIGFLGKIDFIKRDFFGLPLLGSRRNDPRFDGRNIKGNDRFIDTQSDFELRANFNKELRDDPEKLKAFRSFIEERNNSSDKNQFDAAKLEDFVRTSIRDKTYNSRNIAKRVFDIAIGQIPLFDESKVQEQVKDQAAVLKSLSERSEIISANSIKAQVQRIFNNIEKSLEDVGRITDRLSNVTTDTSSTLKTSLPSSPEDLLRSAGVNNLANVFTTKKKIGGIFDDLLSNSDNALANRIKLANVQESFRTSGKKGQELPGDVTSFLQASQIDSSSELGKAFSSILDQLANVAGSQAGEIVQALAEGLSKGESTQNFVDNALKPLNEITSKAVDFIKNITSEFDNALDKRAALGNNIIGIRKSIFENQKQQNDLIQNFQDSIDAQKNFKNGTTGSIGELIQSAKRSDVRSKISDTGDNPFSISRRAVESTRRALTLRTFAGQDNISVDERAKRNRAAVEAELESKDLQQRLDNNLGDFSRRISEAANASQKLREAFLQLKSQVESAGEGVLSSNPEDLTKGIALFKRFLSEGGLENPNKTLNKIGFKAEEFGQFRNILNLVGDVSIGKNKAGIDITGNSITKTFREGAGLKFFETLGIDVKSQLDTLFKLQSKAENDKNDLLQKQIKQVDAQQSILDLQAQFYQGQTTRINDILDAYASTLSDLKGAINGRGTQGLTGPTLDPISDLNDSIKNLSDGLAKYNEQIERILGNDGNMGIGTLRFEAAPIQVNVALSAPDILKAYGSLLANSVMMELGPAISEAFGVVSTDAKNVFDSSASFKRTSLVE